MRISSQVIKHGGLDPAEAEVELVALHLGWAEANRLRVASGAADGLRRVGQTINHRAAWIAKP